MAQKKKIKFLFINKPFVFEPLGVLYIASVIRKMGHEVDFVTTLENLDAKIEDYAPDFVGYSILTGDQDFYDQMNRELKTKFDIFSIAGGPHVTFFPEMLEKSSFDAICLGEGEGAIQKFLENPCSKDIPNFWFKDKDKIVRNSLLPLISDLDTIDFPYRELVFKYEQINNGPVKHFVATRGCPFDCTYCFNKSYAALYKGKGRRVRFRSTENVINEIEQVINLSPTKIVYFEDDVFILKHDWLRSFWKNIKKELKCRFIVI